MLVLGRFASSARARVCVCVRARVCANCHVPQACQQMSERGEDGEPAGEDSSESKQLRRKRRKEAQEKKDKEKQKERPDIFAHMARQQTENKQKRQLMLQCFQKVEECELTRNFKEQLAHLAKALGIAKQLQSMEAMTKCYEKIGKAYFGMEVCEAPYPKHGTVQCESESESWDQGCIGREGTSEAAPEAVRQAVGGGCQSGGERLLSVANAMKLALGVRETVAGHTLGALRGGGYLPPPFQCIPGWDGTPPPTPCPTNASSNDVFSSDRFFFGT